MTKTETVAAQKAGRATRTAKTPICTDFSKFGGPVAARFAEMSQGELFVTETPDLFATYLAAFPAGTNPMLEHRSQHDCCACKQYVRRLGGLVAIENGVVSTVWGDLDLPYPYSEVAAAMDAAVKAAPVKTVFRTKERTAGCSHNYHPKTNERYDHFHGRVADRHFSPDPETKRSEQEAIFQVASRGLAEIKLTDLETVLGLIDAVPSELYRGGEHKPALIGFRDLLRKYLLVAAFGDAAANARFVWENLGDRSARFRNTVIGTLLVDLAEGKDTDAAVKAFETKVAPANYKRPKPVITQRQVEAAVETMTELGLHGALARRYAKPSDISVNDVLFVDNEYRSKMKDGIAALLEGSVTKAAPDLSRAVKITAEEFVATILPAAKSLEVFLENRHQGNFVSLTGADGPERLFKWGNNFSWSYDGDLADSELRRRVQSLGGRVDGVLRFSHRWNYDKRNASLMDLHVFMPGSGEHADGCHNTYPSGQRVGWNRRTDSTSGGVQDVDYTQPAPAGYIPVENITFPTKDKLREGKYVFKIHNWQLREPTQGGFQAEIEFGGQVFQYEVTRPLKCHEWVTVAVATLKGGIFVIEHKIPSATAGQEKWGVKTESLVPVATVCYSPNQWGDNRVGAKHTIFALKGCRNPGSSRTVYNEFLRGDLDKHSRVFEVLANKTKAAYSEEQVSGVGFTAARGDSVTVVVNGKRSYTLSF